MERPILKRSAAVPSGSKFIKADFNNEGPFDCYINSGIRVRIFLNNGVRLEGVIRKQVGDFLILRECSDGHVNISNISTVMPEPGYFFQED